MNNKLLLEAMEEAREAFNDYVEEQGYDPSYFELGLEGYELTDGSLLPKGDLTLEPGWKQSHKYKDIKVEHWKLKDEKNGIEDMYA